MLLHFVFLTIKLFSSFMFELCPLTRCQQLRLLSTLQSSGTRMVHCLHPAFMNRQLSTPLQSAIQSCKWQHLTLIRSVSTIVLSKPNFENMMSIDICTLRIFFLFGIWMWVLIFKTLMTFLWLGLLFTGCVGVHNHHCLQCDRFLLPEPKDWSHFSENISVVHCTKSVHSKYMFNMKIFCSYNVILIIFH